MEQLADADRSKVFRHEIAKGKRTNDPKHGGPDIASAVVPHADAVRAAPASLPLENFRAAKTECPRGSRWWGSWRTPHSALENESQQPRERRVGAHRRRAVRRRRGHAPEIRSNHNRRGMPAVKTRAFRGISRAGGSELASGKPAAGRRGKRGLRMGGESAGCKCEGDGGDCEECFHRQRFRRPARAAIHANS